LKNNFFIIITFFHIPFITSNINNNNEKQKVEYFIRKGNASDHNNLKNLHKKVAVISGGLLRSADEITDEYINEILNASLERGIIFVAEHNNTIIGSVFKYKENIKILNHVLYDGTILVDPDYQGNGIGTTLYTTLLNEVKEHHPEILRINLKVRISNPTIRLYERLGFKKEGEFKNLIRNEKGQLESVISMVWFNPNFKDN